jgi:hypothetical protein
LKTLIFPQFQFAYYSGLSRSGQYPQLSSLAARRNGKDEAGRVLALLGVYRREDLTRALERAVRYRAFSYSAVERILAAQAKPRSAKEALIIEAREQLQQILRQTRLAPRPTADYQALLEETADQDEKDDQQNAHPDDGDQHE